MKLNTVLGIVATALVFVAGPARAQTKANAGFEKLKTLMGEWDGKTEKGKPVRVSYRLASARTALLETLSSPDESEMVTVYHADGNRVALTHYCDANNQPRMRAEPPSGPIRQLAFNFGGATNLAGPSTGHMHKLVVAFEDQDHFTQRWTWRENGREVTEVFHFARKK